MDVGRLLYPKVDWKGREFHIKDMSLGGFCLFDAEEILRLSLGDVFELGLKLSSGKKVNLSCRLVGMSFQKKHFQFIDISEKELLQLEQEIRPGLFAQHMYRSPWLEKRSANASPQVIECWTGPLGWEFQIFDHQDPLAATLRLGEVSATFYRNELPTLPTEFAQNCYLMLHNFAYLTPAMQKLLLNWKQKEHQHSLSHFEKAAVNS